MLYASQYLACTAVQIEKHQTANLAWEIAAHHREEVVKLTERMIERCSGRKRTVCVGQQVGKRLDEGAAVFLRVAWCWGRWVLGAGCWVQRRERVTAAQAQTRKGYF